MNQVHSSNDLLTFDIKTFAAFFYASSVTQRE
jgi:hypothetical protein